jgi:flagellar protein FlaG
MAFLKILFGPDRGFLLPPFCRTVHDSSRATDKEGTESCRTGSRESHSSRFFPEELGMDVNALSRITQGLPAVATPVSADNASQNRQVVQAVKALNKSEMFGEDNGLDFQTDPVSKRLVVRVVNRTTGEVISQIPPEYVLRLADDLKQKS